MNAFITLAQLMALVPEKVSGKAPTPKQLRLQDKPVAISEDGTAICYSSGYVWYKSTSGDTVFPIHICTSYTYHSVTNSITLSKDDLLSMIWFYAVVMIGESRVEENQNYCEEKRHRFYLDEEQYFFDNLPDDEQDYSFINKENLAELLAPLTEKQRTVVYLYYVMELKEREIASMLEISTQCVSSTLKRSIKKLKKIFGTG